MKKPILFLLGLCVSLCACHRGVDSLIGEWEVAKVNVQFDENRSTPELVKQIGEMEKQNHISVDADSVLVFRGLDVEFRGRVSTDKAGSLYLDSTMFGQWTEGQIVTTTRSPIGQIVVTYSKE